MTRLRTVHAVAFRGTAVAALLCGGCSPNVTTVEKRDAEPPTALGYTINFQNQANAVGSALVQILVFDASKATDQTSRVAFCQDLVDRRQRRRDFPADSYTQVADSTLLSPCEMIPSESQEPKGKFDLPYGAYALLVTAQKGSKQQDEILLGCGVGDVTATPTESIVSVSLQPFSQFTAVPPFPQCNRLLDRCNGAANCPPR